MNIDLAHLATKGRNGLRAANSLGRIDSRQEPDFYDELIADLARRQDEDDQRLNEEANRYGD